METLTQEKLEAPPAHFTVYDGIFLVFLALVFCLVTWLGMHTRQIALKTEVAKANGEAWATWLKESGLKRFSTSYGVPACAGGDKASPSKVEPSAGETPAADSATAAATPTEAGTWGACLNELMQSTSLKDQHNPFSSAPPQLVEACVAGDLSTAGGIDIEKSIATPAGSAIPFVKSQLAPGDSIRDKLQLTILVCDKGGYPIKIAELEF